MIFNSSLLIGLSLSSLSIRSPFITNSQNCFSKSFTLRNVNFKKFVFNSFYSNSPISNLTIYKSNFEQFLRSPISMQQEVCQTYQNQEINSHIQSTCLYVTYSRFRRVSSGNSGGAISIIFNSETTTFINNCLFESCSSTSNGGALSFEVDLLSNLYGNLIVSSTNFILCSASNSNNQEIYGGALYFYGKSLDLSNSSFQHCGIVSQAKCGGGAVYARIQNAEKTFFFTNFSNCSVPIQDNLESYGGAIYLFLDNSDSGRVELTCNFNNCRANNGSAVFSSERISLVINSARFTNFNSNPNSIICLSKSPYTLPNNVLIKSLGISYVNCSSNHFFIYAEDGQIKFDNNLLNSGNIYFELDPIFVENVFSNAPFSYDFLKYNPYNQMPVSIYVYVPTLPPASTPIPLPTQTQITITDLSQTQDVTSSQSETDTLIFTYSATESISASDGAGAASADSGQKKGLSTVAIVFIVLACIIFVIGLIIATILLFFSKDSCYRNKCTGSDNYLGKRVDYF